MGQEHPGYPQKRIHGIVALLEVGCTVSGVARFMKMSRTTIGKYQSRRDAIVATYKNVDEFLRVNLRRDYEEAIKQRTADGQAGKLNQSVARNA